MIGNRIKEIRKALKKKQEEFAGLLGVTHSAISQIENARVKPSKKLLEAICSIYNVNPEWLENGEGPMFKDVGSGFERFSPAHKLLIERFTKYFVEKIPAVETERTIKAVHGLIDIFMTDKEDAKKALEYGIQALLQVAQSHDDKQGKEKSGEKEEPLTSVNAHPTAKKTKAV